MPNVSVLLRMARRSKERQFAEAASFAPPRAKRKAKRKRSRSR